MLLSEVLRTELSLNSYHLPPFLAQAVQCPPPSPPQWLLMAYRSQIGSELLVIPRSPSYFGGIMWSLILGSLAQSLIGNGLITYRFISKTPGKLTFDSFFSLRISPFCLNLFRCNISILGARQMLISLFASLCSLQLGQYHSLPASSCSNSLKVSKQCEISTGPSSVSRLSLCFLDISSKSFSLSKLKYSELLGNLTSSSQSFQSIFLKKSSRVSLSPMGVSSSNLYQSLLQNLSSFLPYLRQIWKGRELSICVSYSSYDFPPNIFLFLFSLQASLKRNLSMRLQMVKPVVSRQKQKGNLNHKLSQSEQQLFLLNLPGIYTRFFIFISSSVICTTKIFLLSFSTLYTISAMDSRPALQIPSFMLTKQMLIVSGGTDTMSETDLIQSSTLGLEQVKEMRLVFCSKLRAMKNPSNTLTTF